MPRKTVLRKFRLLLLTFTIITVIGGLSISTLAQELTPESFFPLIQRDSQATPPPTQTLVCQPVLDQVDVEYISGYRVPTQVYEFYLELGPDVAGRPISEYRFDEAANRCVMLFENVGIFIEADDPNQKVNMLPLGIQRAFESPQVTQQPNAIPIAPSILQLFEVASSRLGTNLTGKELVELGLDVSGNPTRIYENVVMKIELGSDEQVVFYAPLPEILGIASDPLVPSLQDDRFRFFPIEGDQGHNIPLQFWDFIRNQADLSVSGQPITEIFYADEEKTIVRQCFENLCLDYDIANESIRPSPLGVEYYRLIQNSNQLDVESLPTVNLTSWEAEPAISANEDQVIYVRISQNKLPIINVQPLLEITLPDESLITYQMPASDLDGVSALQIPKIDAPNGTIIPYQVCLVYIDATRFCISEQFLIWNTP